MHRNHETLMTFFSSGTKLLLPSWLLGFWHEERETHDFYYADCFYIVLQFPAELLAQSQNLNSLTQQTRASRGPQTGLASPSFKSQLASPRDKSQLTSPSRISTNCFFQKSPKFPALHFRAWRQSHPSPVSYLGFLLWHLWLSHPPRASVNCTQCVHLHRIVLSLTKLNDKI